MKPIPTHRPNEVRDFIATMRQAKEAEGRPERTPMPANVNIYTDALLRVTVVVEINGVLWLVPKSTNGWVGRPRLNMTPKDARRGATMTCDTSNAPMRQKVSLALFGAAVKGGQTRKSENRYQLAIDS